MKKDELIKLLENIPDDMEMNGEFVRYYLLILMKGQRVLELETELKATKNNDFLQALSYFRAMKSKHIISDCPIRGNGYSLDFRFIDRK